MIDSCDIQRLKEARDEIFAVIGDDGMERGVPLVILANKQDLPGALKSWELIEKLDLGSLKSNPWYVQEMCAVTGDGLYEGASKMAEMVNTFRKR